MRQIIILLVIFSLGFSAFSADTIKVKSTITDVTLFFSGAQITREASFDAKAGKQTLAISPLPGEVYAQSIRVEGSEQCKILSVKHRVVQSGDAMKEREVVALQDEITKKENLIKEIKSRLQAFEVEEKLLSDNSKLGPKGDGTSISEIKEAANFYRQRISEIGIEKIKLADQIEQTTKEIKTLYAEINKLIGSKLKPYSEIMVSVDCTKGGAIQLKLLYYVPSAAWVPLYDFRVDDINKPFNIVYNAGVYQSTGEDWNKVNLTLSNSNPSLSSAKPELSPWYIERKTAVQNLPATYGGAGALKGRITEDESGEPVPFANVVVEKDNNIVTGGVTDFEGQYLIKPIPAGTYEIKVRYIGYNEAKVSPISIKPNIVTTKDFQLTPSSVMLESVVINYNTPLTSEVTFKAKKSSASSKVASRYDTDKSSSGFYAPLENKAEVVETNYISNTLKDNIVNLEYAIEIPYTIPSNGEEYNIKIKEVSTPVKYVYYAVPKLDKDVFLSAEITNQSSLNLLSGKAAVYYRGTYTGETFIDAGNTSDTLSVSLGRDLNVMVDRVGKRELFDKRVIGNYVKETMAWEVSVKNSKSAMIDIIVEDQLPLSERKAIEIEQIDLSGATFDDKTGKLSWKLKVAPGAKHSFTYKYSVKYPKSLTFSLE